MSRLVNFLLVPIKGIVIVVGALFSLLALIGVGLSALAGGKAQLAATLSAPVNQRRVFTLLRTFLPNLVIGKRVITAYDNNGTAVVTRDPDVREVLDHDDVFHVVYEPKMRKVTDGANFFLGMQNTPDYTRDTSDMRLAARREDVAEILVPFVAEQSAELVGHHAASIDLPQDLSFHAPARMVGRYFGTPGRSQSEMIEWTTYLFWYLFVDLKGDLEVEKRALDAAAGLREYLDATIAERKKSGSDQDDVLGRCLKMQSGNAPGMDDLGIRNNLVGLIIGAIPTIGSSCALALDQLLDRPSELREAQAAARADDDTKLASYVFEAFRFQPLNPIIYRRAVEDYVVAKGTLRAKTIPKDSMVVACNLSAMFDPWNVKRPNQFRIDRPWDVYMLWGYGLHACFGQYINRAVIPQVLKPLLKKNNLRRAPGERGKIDTADTPFPQHMTLEYDA